MPSRAVNVSVDFRGEYALVTEHFLNSTQVGAIFYEVGGERMAEGIGLCQKNRLEPKILQILTPSSDKKPHLFLLKCVMDGKTGLSVLPQRIVRTEV